MSSTQRQYSIGVLSYRTDGSIAFEAPNTDAGFVSYPSDAVTSTRDFFPFLLLIAGVVLLLVLIVTVAICTGLYCCKLNKEEEALLVRTGRKDNWADVDN